MIRDKDIEVKGLAHITGGSFRKLKRLNDKVTYYIDNLPEPLPIFKEIQRLGNVPDEEMFRTFNMGIGFCVIVDEEDANKVIKIANKYNIPAQVIGRVVDSLEVNGNKIVGKAVVKYNDKHIILE